MCAIAVTVNLQTVWWGHDGVSWKISKPLLSPRTSHVDDIFSNPILYYHFVETSFAVKVFIVNSMTFIWEDFTSVSWVILFTMDHITLHRLVIWSKYSKFIISFYQFGCKWDKESNMGSPWSYYWLDTGIFNCKQDKGSSGLMYDKKWNTIIHTSLQKWNCNCYGFQLRLNASYTPTVVVTSNNCMLYISWL